MIDRDLAGKLGIIPLHLSGNLLTLGLTDPDNLLFVRKLDLKFPQYRFLPVFIPFSGFKWFYSILYPKAPSSFTPKTFHATPADGKKTPQAAQDMKRSAIQSWTNMPSPGYSDNMKPCGWDTKPRNNHETYNYRQVLFADFIRDSYYEITAQSGCKTIQFYVRQQKGRAMIIAKPVDKGLKGKEITK